MVVSNGRSIVVRLGDVVQHVRDTIDPGAALPGTIYVGLENLEKETGRLLGTADVSSIRSRVQLFDAGDVLYGRMRPNLRKAHVPDMPGSASGEIIVMRCSEMIVPDYLLTILLSDHFSRFAERTARGDRPRTSFGAISSYEINLPSLGAQYEVAARNRAATDTLASIRAARDKTIYYADEVQAKVRENLIWGSVAVPRAALGSLVESIAYGTSAKSSYDAVGSPVLRIPNIGGDGALESDDLKFASLDDDEVKKHSVDEGDLLFIRSNGSASLVGRAAIVDQLHRGYCFAGYLLRVRPSKEACANFLLQVTKSIGFRKLVASVTRSTAGIHNLSAKRLAQLEIPNPPRDMQREIAVKLQMHDEIIDSVRGSLGSFEHRAKRALAEARRLWLSQPNEHEFERSRDCGGTEKQQIERQKRGSIVGDLAAARARILDQLGEMERPVRFDEVFATGGEEYDLLRDALFALLSEKPARVHQEHSAEQGVLLRLEP
ncbi:restriction endonuclease subunit S [Microbacterium paraoxydans]|uniref:restriction endonuclease subunit S n=1 Tax=Microbacterium paraoxydans TaxID=199592 RepID=UPI003D72AFC0